MIRTTDAWLEINLDAVEYNVKKLVEYAAPAEVMAVIKADACGHGALPLAPIIIRAGAKRLGVARVTEALELRRAGISVPIHILGFFNPAAIEEIVKGDFIVDPKSIRIAEKLSSMALKYNKQISVHIEVDTGLCRWGTPQKSIDKYVEHLRMYGGISVDGMFTHFSNLDDGNYIDTEKAYREFIDIADLVEKLLGKKLTRHVCNTVGTLTLPHMHLDMVRPGVGLYGLLALSLDTPFSMQPALSLKSTIGLIREVEAGFSVGYGSLYKLKDRTKIAVVPLGFGDGLPPQIGLKGEALVKETRVPIIGKISTDAVIIDIGLCYQVRLGDEVIFIGRSGNEQIKAEELARNLNIFVDPILINLGRGLHREYCRSGIT